MTYAEKVYRCARLHGNGSPCQYYNIGGAFMCGLKKADVRELDNCKKWEA